MAPKPIADNAQKQRLTTALKGICRDYPAGGGVLRELLQNTDDAGATEVRFHLDEQTYPTTDLLHTALSDYQGPALLAYNNAIFKENDFQSLSDLGNSRKAKDGATTGKFGLGFNSVYNWTDSPSIVSRERILILDPHHDFSNGGDVYDFVTNAHDAEIQNHMAAFQSDMGNFLRPFEGTVIRIPLRTSENARKSDICSRETTAKEIREVLKQFAIDFGDSGLLFMRNVTKVYIDSTTGMSISVEMFSGDNIAGHKTKVKDALNKALNDPSFSFNHSFEAAIKRCSGQETKETSFVIHHSISGDGMDKRMREWAKECKYQPWVAIASQIPYPESFQGSLFTVLPLPIPIEQPVFVHGLFCLSSDRRRLQSKDSSSQDQSQAKWNEWLLQHPITIAWAKLLQHLARLRTNTSTFEWWPRYTDNPSHPFKSVLENVVATIIKDSLPLWSTSVGHITAEQGFLNVGEKSPALQEAFREAKVPVIYVPSRLYRFVEQFFTENALDPRRLSIFLRHKNEQIHNWSLSTKQFILEYLLSDPKFSDIGFLDLFPFKDGKHRSIDHHTAFVDRDELEIELFKLQEAHIIDINKFSSTACSVLRNWCSGSAHAHKSVRYRSPKDFRDYCDRFIFTQVPKDQDTVSLDAGTASFVSKVWIWIVKNRIDIPGVISDLWLLPLTNNQHRRVKPHEATSDTILTPPGLVGDFMRAFDIKYSLNVKPLLQGDSLESPAMDLLTVKAKSDASLLIRDGNVMEDFSRWLDQIQSVLNTAPDEEKHKLLKILADHFRLPKCTEQFKSIQKSIGSLQIFRKVTSSVDDGKVTSGLEWTSIEASVLSFGLSDGIVTVPEIDGIQFLNATFWSDSWKLLCNIKLAKCFTTTAVVEQLIIPNWRNFEQGASPYAHKEQVARLVLSQFSALQSSSQLKLGTLSLVPVARIDGTLSSKFSFAKKLINPQVLRLKDLFFDDEEFVPENDFLMKFRTTLNEIGLKTTVDKTMVISRTRYYATCNHPPREIQQRVHELLMSPCSWRGNGDNVADRKFRSRKWLPILNTEGNLDLKSPDECRPVRDKDLVSSQRPIFDMHLSPEWVARLGWDDVLSEDVLLGQLDHGIQKRERPIVDAVLTYIVEQDLVPALLDNLKSMSCILTSTGLYVPASKAFLPPEKRAEGCEGLHPYLGDLDKKFWKDHQTLLGKMKIAERPSLRDLIAVQETLRTQVPLSDSDIAVAIETLQLASRLQNPPFPGLHVVDRDGHLHPIEKISYDDLGPLNAKGEVVLTHNAISQACVTALGIQSLREQQIKGLLEIEDIDDEDEFEQQEKTTTRIVDTLGRYPADSTFREYLAHADDTEGASKIRWLLDERTHSKEKLIDPELKLFQGPALLVHNDGVFSEADYKGFKDVGEGSKRDNERTIGQFGRGSQTMYHWTDVPMILSGNYLLILDPQQKVLPKNLIKGKRKPGVKLEISKLRGVCPDHLAPFAGLWDYNLDLDYYPGTIFRFPLRDRTVDSRLNVHHTELTTEAVRQHFDTYFDEARVSLLFLKRIRLIEFTVYGRPVPEWSVTREKPSEDEPEGFSGWVKCLVTRTLSSGQRLTAKDKWWVTIEDLKPKIAHLPYSPIRVMKNIECGIAGLISTAWDSRVAVNIFGRDAELPLKPPEPRFFNSLPLSEKSGLPVFIHASFHLTGDRRSVVADGRGLESQNSRWNKHLLTTTLPDLYLSFLGEIGRHVLEKIFDFWPQKDHPEDSCCGLLCSAFWDKVPQSSGALFPKDGIVSGSVQRQRPVFFDFRRAIFDFLSPHQSVALAPLMLSLNVNLVRNIPNFIAEHLIGMPNVQSITPTMLSSLLQTEEGKLALQEELSNPPSPIDHILQLVVSPRDSLAALDGCHILPLLNKSVGTLRLLTKHPKAVTYYFVSDEEAAIFKFASGRLVSSSEGHKLGKVVDSEEFNLKKFELRHVAKLMERKNIAANAMTPSSPSGDLWLQGFWAYWNRRQEETEPAPSVDHEDLRGVFHVTNADGSFYVSFQKLSELPAVVEPSNQSHRDLCTKFPKLQSFSSEFMPTALKESEESLISTESFFRSFYALQTLAGEEGKSLGAFVYQHCSHQELELFRKLVVLQTSITSNRRTFEAVKDALRTIPLWPSTNPSARKLVSAEKAMIVDTTLIVPWIKNYSRCIDPSVVGEVAMRNPIQWFGFKTYSINHMLTNEILPLPDMSADGRWLLLLRNIVSFLADPITGQGIAINTRTFLSEHKFAVNGNKVACNTNELFDHENRVFKAAFRGQESTKFLHKELQSYASFWRSIGLRQKQGGTLQPSHYIECLQAQSQRLSASNNKPDTHLAKDTEIVLYPLTTPGSMSLEYFSNNETAILKERVFESQSDFSMEPKHRRTAMEAIAPGRPLLTLAEVISYDQVAICWSQTQFPIHAPTHQVLAAIPSQGNPPIEMVWAHLEYLAELSQSLEEDDTSAFLQDVQSTYTYLQGHLAESESTFEARRRKDLWLNIDSFENEEASLDEVKSSWNKLEDLFLASYEDIGPTRWVRGGLLRYEKLLKALGCKAIYWAERAALTPHAGYSIAAAAQLLKAEKKLVDVTFCTEGKEIQAHRTVLAAVSTVFAAQWSGSDPLKDREELDGILSYHAISTIIDYAYEDKINWAEMQVSDEDDQGTRKGKLQLLLGIHKGAHAWQIPSLKSEVEGKILAAGRIFLNIGNAKDLRDQAEAVGAKAVEKMCADFIENNGDAIRRVSGVAEVEDEDMGLFVT